jgi:hypothetical protein
MTTPIGSYRTIRTLRSAFSAVRRSSGRTARPARNRPSARDEAGQRRLDVVDVEQIAVALGTTLGAVVRRDERG